MNWRVMQAPFKDMQMWGARSGPHSFVITKDAGLYSVSVNTGRLRVVNWFEEFNTFEKAKEACELWLKERILQ